MMYVCNGGNLKMSGKYLQGNFKMKKRDRLIDFCLDFRSHSSANLQTMSCRLYM